jgi:oligopeptide/dipeptide ABC transporter ATP-binding protein
VSLSVGQGEIVGLVGESGSGKTATALSILRLVPAPGRIVGGEILFGGRDLLQLNESAMRQLRGNELSLVFQNPLSALNPNLTIGWQFKETVVAHKRASWRSAKQLAVQALVRVGIADAARRLDDYPHQFSGGMRQRVAIAIALGNQPRLLVADEPTSALDVTIQLQILTLLRNLATDLGVGILLISHDLGVVAHVCDRVVVMYAGEVVEEAKVSDLFQRPLHPYTKGLIDSVMSREGTQDRLTAMPGRPPEMWGTTAGCRFRARCSWAQTQCEEHPSLRGITPGHLARCWVSQAAGTL